MGKINTDYRRKTENLGLAIDRIDNIANGLKLPLPDAMHLQQLKILLPEIVQELKLGFIEATGENPWE
jgi:hypothetical protein